MSALRTLPLAAFAVLATACATFHAYEGPRRPPGEVAIIYGDARVRAFTPLSLFIRAVDGKPVDARYSSVALLPGEHKLLVDCRVGADATSARIVRLEVEVEVFAGERYRLREELDPGNRGCRDVVLERT